MFRDSIKRISEDIVRTVAFEEKRATFLTESILNNRNEELGFMNEHFDKAITSIKSGIKVLEGDNKLDPSFRSECIYRLKTSLELTENGKNIINS
jgi:hypothetical protein